MNAKFAQTETLNRHIGLRAALTPLAMALGFMLSNPALADGKEYPGTMCEESNLGHDGKLRKSEGNIVFTGEGEALNSSTDNFSRLITCPLVRDGERHQGEILYAAVNVYKPSNKGVACSLVSRPYFGGEGWVQHKGDSSDNAGLRLIEFPVQADSFTSGSYNLFCWVPPRVPPNPNDPKDKGQESGIAHYGIVEAD